MKKFNILAGLAVLVVAGVATAAQPSQGQRGEREADVTRQQVIERSGQRFARLDINNDGQVTVEEAQQSREQRRAQRAGASFERLDLDRNGSVSRAEFEQARNQRSERRAERGKHRRGGAMRGAHRAGAGGARGMFGGQNVITRAQFQEQALARFDRQDANRDGTVTVAERRAAFQQRRAQRQDRRERD